MLIKSWLIKESKSDLQGPEFWLHQSCLLFTLIYQILRLTNVVWEFQFHLSYFMIMKNGTRLDSDSLIIIFSHRFSSISFFSCFYLSTFFLLSKVALALPTKGTAISATVFLKSHKWLLNDHHFMVKGELEVLAKKLEFSKNR